MNRPIGQVAEVEGAVIPILYPGEMAISTKTVMTEEGTIHVLAWRIEPLSGWHGWWLRWRYRLVDRLFGVIGGRNW
jgi:hypothetical protein